MRKFAASSVIYNKKIATGIYEMLVRFPADISDIRAGQIASIYPAGDKNLLPRPISICDFDKEKNTLRFVYQLVGDGTRYFSTLEKGDNVDILAPIGNGYNVTSNRKKITIVGGGVGIPPLFALAKAVIAKNPGSQIDVFLGFRGQETILVSDFESLGVNVIITTDDGSLGYKGNAVSYMTDSNYVTELVYACGPKIMLKFLWQYCEKINVPCFVSMEERMGCGLGVCIGCVVLVKPRGEGENYYKKICKDGPVFNAKELVWL